MKYLSAIVVLNAIVVLFTVFVFFAPFVILGGDAGLAFWRSSWYPVPVLLLLLAGMDWYFARNFRVFSLLEKEDWPALVRELESRVLHRGRYSPALVRLLANSYLVLSDAASVTALEKKLAAARPALLNANVLVFGAARLLSGDYRGAAEFFRTRLSGRGGEWLSWYYGFALLLDRQFGPAADRFLVLVREARDGIVAGLSTYFLGITLRGFLPEKDLGGAALAGRERVRRVLGRREDWDREIRRLGTEVHAAVLAGYLGKAGDYLYL